MTKDGVDVVPVRPEEAPLHDDVRWLAASLGSVIRRLEGEEAFQAVESLRQATRARRHGDDSSRRLDELLGDVDALPIELMATVARAFTLFFLLINTAEQVHRVRRARDYQRQDDAPPQPGSARRAMQSLRTAGLSRSTVEAAMRRLHVRPVLTAHPTESTRRTLLALQARVADLLLARDGASAADRAALEEALDAEVEMLWITAEVRDDRPTVKDEVSTVLWYLETRLLDAGESARVALLRAFTESFGEPDDELREIVPLQLGNWVGGDRDGNPFVTPDVTLATARRASYAILGRYHSALIDLTERVSASAELAPPSDALLDSIEQDRETLPEVYEANRGRNAHEPLRLKLTMMAARVEARRRLTASRDAGHPVEEPAAYGAPEEFERDLRLVEANLLAAGATRAANVMLDPLIAAVRAHGFHGFRTDLRDHADVHRAAVSEIAKRPSQFSEATQRVRDTFSVMRTIQDECGPEAANTYIVSMTKTAEDLNNVLLLASEAGLSGRIDVVPLFETLDDLEHAPAVMRSLLDDATYRKQLAARGNRQEIMIGYSDSGKDAGILASSWALYRGQESLASLFREAGVELTLFHGRGGSVGRGGGSPVARALAALPPRTVDGRIKITEQGEIISQQFGLLPIAERTFEVTLAGVLLQSVPVGAANGQFDHEANGDGEVMDDLAKRGLEVYRSLVHQSGDLFTLFLTATPVEELAGARFGSRPSYRPGAKPGIEGIRAIPWSFGWTQIRLMINGWLGAGTALSHYASTDEGLQRLRDMAARWPFFDDLLAKIEMVCAKTDLEIARAYVESLDANTTLLVQLEQEYRDTVQSILRIRGTHTLLSDNEVLRSAIALRNPYVDPLSLIQIALMKRKRTEGGSERVDAILATTLSGIAQGLRNTG
jgi:phosphoenolpyruvate carboxylase